MRVLIADDHPVFRFGMKALLSTEADIKIIGEASDGRKVLKLAVELKPDVILMDINMPEVNGIEATRQIVRAHPEIAILIVTMLDDDSLFSAMRAGARGYLLKGAEGEETLRAIRSAAAGEAIFSPRVAERLIHFFANPSLRPSTHPFPELTPREREILDLIAQGLTNHAIAERLVLSPKTVRNQVSTIFSKLQVASRGEAIVKARGSQPHHS
ncbi:MAG: response regulator transcription factor [Chloroflexi bacterium]|nr:response regulator transcription factor [Chloroflexota bacterium]